MGGLRYKAFGAPNKPKYDRVESIIKRIKLYQQTGNGEHLVDVANEALCEFTEPVHPAFHFEAADDGTHTEVTCR